MDWGSTYVLQLGSFKILTDPILSPKGDSAFIIRQHPTTGAMDVPAAGLIAPAALAVVTLAFCSSAIPMPIM